MTSSSWILYGVFMRKATVIYYLLVLLLNRAHLQEKHPGTCAISRVLGCFIHDCFNNILYRLSLPVFQNLRYGHLAFGPQVFGLTALVGLGVRPAGSQVVARLHENVPGVVGPALDGDAHLLGQAVIPEGIGDGG